jgi:hypothetical protein
MHLLFLAEEFEEDRCLYGGYPSVKRVERCQTAKIWRGASRRVGDREGRYSLEVFRAIGYVFRRRPEELIPEVRELCKVRA